MSFLPIVSKVDSATSPSSIYHFRAHDGTILGKVLPFVAKILGTFSIFTLDDQNKTLNLQEFKTTSERTAAVNEVMEVLRGKKQFNVLEGWRYEQYPVYNPSKKLYFTVERSSACLLGLVTYGVHITGYVPAASPADYKIWVPRRSFSKPTWPGMLDNTVAGGLGYPYGPWQTCLKECEEEASLGATFVLRNLRAVGLVSYEFQLSEDLTSEQAVYQPEVEYIYDLVMQTQEPRPSDNEVAEFYLMTIPEVKQKLLNGEFKYNCGLVLVDFFIRHGIVNAENEPNYLEIIEHCHRQLNYPLR